jgi:hypothetical protein
VPTENDTSTRGRTTETAGSEAGFRDVVRRDIERLAERELQGVLEQPKLLSDVGLWVTLLSRELEFEQERGKRGMNAVKVRTVN